MVAKKQDVVTQEVRRGGGDVNTDVADLGEGDELDPSTREFDQDDLAVPRIKILQDLSPETKKTKAEFIEGAKPGMLYNSASQKLYDAEHVGVILIPCAYRASYVEWVPNRGGFVADRSDEPGIKELWQRAFAKRKEDPSGKNQSLIATGNVLDRSADHYVLIAQRSDDLTVADFEEAVLTLGGSQMKKSKAWNTKVAQQRAKAPDGRTVRVIAPFFAYVATTLEESNDTGTWMGIKIADLGQTKRLPDGVAIYEQARSFRNLVLEGKKRAVADAPTEDGAADDGDIPF